MFPSVRQKILLALLLILLPITVGTAGYMLIESYGFLDAVYMTVITMATVGFGEIKPLHDAGRIFTIFLIIFNIGTFTYAITLISGYLLQEDFVENYRKRKMKDKIKSLHNHVIICGFGRNGHSAADLLRKNHIPFVVIENKKELIDQYISKEHILYLTEDATKDETLLDAGIERARGLISTLPNDADNVYVVLTARELNKDLTIISRASTNTSFSKLKRAGANNVIMPDRIGGAHMASLIVRPDVNEFIDIISGQGGAGIQIVEVSMDRILKKHAAHTITDLNLRKICGVNVLGIRNPDGSYSVNPEPDTFIADENKLIVLGTDKQMEKFFNWLN